MPRPRRTKSEWEALLSKQEESGQSVKEWCTENGINVYTMYKQIVKRRKANSDTIDAHTTESLKMGKEKTNHQANNTVLIEWKELRTSTEEQLETNRKGSVYIEVGGMRLAADVGYPVSDLAALCKELRQTC